MIKPFISVILSLLALTATAQTPVFRTQDNVDYNILLQEGLSESDTKNCVGAISSIAKLQGNGTFTYLSEIGIVTTNLTTFGADQVKQLFCVSAMEESREVHAAPRVGRQN